MFRKDGIIYSYKDAVAHIVSTGIQSPNPDLSIYGFEELIPEPAPPQPVTVITKMQGELAISASGLWEKYQDFVESMTRDERIVWDNTQYWHMNDPLIIAGAADCDTGDMLQDLFNTASVL